VVKEGTLRVQATNSWSSFEVTTDGVGVVGHTGAALLRELADRLGLIATLDWHQVGGRHRHADAAVLRDLAVMLADGGDCLSDLAVLRDQPALFGPVASTATAWRVIERAGQDPDGLARLRAARAHARARAWTAGGDPDVALLIIDADATLVLAQTDAKQGAAGTYKHSFGFAPLLAYLDRGQAPGEPLAGLLRPGNASPGAARDLIEWSTSPWPSSLLTSGRCWSAPTAPAAAPCWHGTCASAASGSPWAGRSTPMSARRSLPSRSRRGPPRSSLTGSSAPAPRSAS
jgi:hypothetical protein